MSPIRLDPFQMITSFHGGDPADPRCLVDKEISTLNRNPFRPVGERGVWEGCTEILSFPARDFVEEGVGGTNAADCWRNCSNMASFGNVVLPTSVVNLFGAWGECSSLTGFPSIDTSSVTGMVETWFRCSSLTSFPVIDTSSVTDMRNAWFRCSSLTSFPVIDTSSVTDMVDTWKGCSSLTSFPSIDTSSVTVLFGTWSECSSLDSFPIIDVSSVTDMRGAWSQCSSLTSFPGGILSGLPSTSVSVGLAFSGVPLSHGSLSSVLQGLAGAPSTYSGGLSFGAAATIAKGSAEHEWARQVCNKGAALSVRVSDSGPGEMGPLRDCDWLLSN